MGSLGSRHWLDESALSLSRSSLLWIPGILLVGYWLWVSWREALLAAPVLAASIGLLDFVGARIKDLAARPRPCMALPDIHQIEACGKTFGFPSNHAINTATAAAFFHVLYPRSGWVSWPLVGLIGLSRVYIGAHYVTDVVGWVGDRRRIRSRSCVVASSLFSCPFFDGESHGLTSSALTSFHTT